MFLLQELLNLAGEHNMLSLDRRIEAFTRLGEWMNSGDSALEGEIVRARHENAWFTEEEVRHALRQWSALLKAGAMENWMKQYTVRSSHQKTVGVVNAGNIPLVGFHDFLSVLLSGHRYQGKCAADDSVLLPFLAGKLMNLESGFRDRIEFVPRLEGFDAVIATGSNNSARYFTYYFSRFPQIIRRNRNGVALLDGGENDTQMEGLAEDVFRYFGLGCRNVSHLLLPEGYDFSRLFVPFESRAAIHNHHKYCNNYDYYKAVLALKRVPFFDNGFLIVKQDEAIATPISILNYTFYSSTQQAEKWLEERKASIQCILSSSHIPFGRSQMPALDDYADGVDTLRFLTNL